jgi:hypothetical protein
VPLIEVMEAYPVRVPAVHADMDFALSRAVCVAAIVMLHSYRVKTETSVNPNRFAKSGYRFWSAQKFFRARHFGQPLPTKGCRATVSQ